MKVLVFGLTGLGNIVVERLKKLNIEIVAVVSRKEKGKYPYFEIESLEDLCSKLKISKVDIPERGPKWIEEIIEYWNSSDLVLSATFHRIIPIKKLSPPKYGAFNIHPSLLPRHRGPSPVFWSIINDSKYGYTVHELTSEADSGRYCHQQAYNISEQTLGQALLSIYTKIGNDLTSILESIVENKTVIPVFEETYEGRPEYKEISVPVELKKETLRYILAHIPYPGVYAVIYGKRFNVNGVGEASDGLYANIDGTMRKIDLKECSFWIKGTLK